jgi:hypothetical protein
MESEHTELLKINLRNKHTKKSHVNVAFFIHSCIEILKQNDYN